MRVRDLIEELQKVDPDLIVIMSKDEEGNGFKSLAVAQEDYAYKEGYGWEVVAPEDVEEYEDVISPVVCLWP